MSDSFNRLKKRMQVIVPLAGILLVIGWIAAGQMLPGLLAGVVRILLVIAFFGSLFWIALSVGGSVLAKRREEVKARAKNSGYSFEPTVSVNEGAEFLKQLNRFAIFAHERGILGKHSDSDADAKVTKTMDWLGNLGVTNRVSGESGSHQFQAFDYRNKSHSTHGSKMADRTTVFLFALPDSSLPQFRLVPRSGSQLVRKVVAKLDGNEIKLPDYPHLWQHFLLSGSDEQAVTAIFDHGLTTYLQQLSQQFEDVTIEASGNQLLVFRFGQLAEDSQFDGLLSAATRIASFLCTDT